MSNAVKVSPLPLHNIARGAALRYEQIEIPFLCEHHISTPAVLKIYADGYCEGYRAALAAAKEGK